jgi:hypothetical protein
VKLGIMQPYLFPYIGYFQLMHAVDRFVVYDDVTFIKQGWINRNRILINGEASFFSVPIKHASSFTSIRDTRIDDDAQHRRWVAKLLKTFDNAYRRAPEFPHVFPMVEAVLARAATHVAELAVDSLRVVADYLDIRTPWVETSTIYGNSDLKGEDRVLDICRVEQASAYINPAGGVELYSRERFAAEGVALGFLKPRPIEYSQFKGPFVPWLSIVDVLMFNSRSSCQELLDHCDVE